MTGELGHRGAILRQRQDERLLWVDQGSGHWIGSPWLMFSVDRAGDRGEFKNSG